MALWCGGASGCLCHVLLFHAAVIFPKFDREIELESLRILQKDSGTQAKALLFSKAKMNGWCD